MKPIVCVETQTVDAPAGAVFAVASGPEVPGLFMRHGAIPGVIGVSGHVAAWSAPGEVRELTLNDGGYVREELVAFALNEGFAYKVTGFTGLFAALVREAQGSWRFLETAPGRTQIEWTYSFTPASAIVSPVAGLIVRALWPGYMRAALMRIKEAAETKPSA